MSNGDKLILRPGDQEPGYSKDEKQVQKITREIRCQLNALVDKCPHRVVRQGIIITFCCICGKTNV